MSLLRARALFFIVALVTTMGIGSSGCERGNFARRSAALMDFDDVRAFQTTLYAVTTQRCAACHSARQNPLHASPDVGAAYSAVLPFVNFESIQLSRIVERSKNGHCGVSACMTDGSPFVQAIQDWKDARAAFRVPSSKYDPAFPCGTNPNLKASSVRRLAKIQYINSIREFLSRLPTASTDALIIAIAPQMSLFPDDSDPSYTRSDVNLFPDHVDGVFEVASALSANITGDPGYTNALVSVCGAGSTVSSLSNAGCLSTFVNYYGRKTLRRPLTSAETSDFVAFYNGLPSADRLTGLLGRLLSHPQFFYSLDNEGTKVSGTEGLDASYQLTKYELMSKMTFLFWSAPPDDALYTLVAPLDLTQSGPFNQVLDSVLLNAKTKTGVRNFYYEWLKLERVPGFDTKITALQTLAAGENLNVPGHDHRGEMLAEILDMTEYYTLTTSGRYDDLMNSTYSFAKGADLAKLYGVPVWSGSTGSMVSFPPQQRSGLLTRGAFLVSGIEYTRPIIKGREIRVQLLCDQIPPPPPALMIKPLVQVSTSTTRDIVHHVTNNSSCLGCHSQMNPLGFVTENYDSLGRYRTSEVKFDTLGAIVNQLPVSTQVSPANLFPGDTKDVDDAIEMGAWIANSGKGQHCMVQQYFRYAYGRAESDTEDGCSLENMRLQLTQPTNGSLLQMLRETTRQLPFKVRKVK